ncbi:MAG: glycosyltransferase, partial [Candidatus Omnitrophica bacterium]|nr:glycosyltransferase [Candidatus Omnitrophota bacterium]
LANDELNKLRTALEEVNKKIEELISATEDSQDQTADIQDKLKEVNDTIENLKEIAKQSRLIANDLDSIVRKATALTQQIQAKIDEARKKVEEAEKKVSETERVISSLQEEISETQSRQASQEVSPIPDNGKKIITVGYYEDIYSRLHNEVNALLKAGQVGRWDIKVQFPNRHYLGVVVTIEQNGEVTVVFETPLVRQTLDRAVAEIENLSLPSNINTVTIISNPCNSCGSCGGGIKATINNPLYKDQDIQRLQALEAELKEAKANLVKQRAELENARNELKRWQEEKQKLDELIRLVKDTADKAREFADSVDKLHKIEFKPTIQQKPKQQPKVEIKPQEKLNRLPPFVALLIFSSLFSLLLKSLRNRINVALSNNQSGYKYLIPSSTWRKILFGVGLGLLAFAGLADVIFWLGLVDMFIGSEVYVGILHNVFINSSLFAIGVSTSNSKSAPIKQILLGFFITFTSILGLSFAWYYSNLDTISETLRFITLSIIALSGYVPIALSLIYKLIKSNLYPYDISNNTLSNRPSGDVYDLPSASQKVDSNAIETSISDSIKEGLENPTGLNQHRYENVSEDTLNAIVPSDTFIRRLLDYISSLQSRAPPSRKGMLSDKKIAFVYGFNFNSAGGTETYSYSLIGRLVLSNPGIQIHLIYPVFSYDDSNSVIVNLSNGSCIYFHPFKITSDTDFEKGKSLGYKLGLVHSRYKIDLITQHFTSYDAIVLSIFNKITGVPVVTYYHGGETYAELLGENYIRLLYGNATAVATVSESGKRGLLKYLPDQDVVVVGPQFFMEEFDPEKVDSELVEKLRKNYNLEGKFVILSPNRLAPDKFPEHLIELAESLNEEGKDFVLVFVGTESKPNYTIELEELIRKKGIQSKVIFVGGVFDIKLLRAWYSVSDVVILPTRAEGLGLVILEGQLMKKPVVVYRVDGTPETLIDGETGFLVDVDIGDIDGLYKVIVRLMNEPTLRQSMGEKGRKFVLDNFDPEKLIDRHIMLYKKAMEEDKSNKSIPLPYFDFSGYGNLYTPYFSIIGYAGYDGNKDVRFIEVSSIEQNGHPTKDKEKFVGFFGNLNEDNIQNIEAEIINGNYIEANDLSELVSTIEGMPTKFFILTTQPQRAPPKFIYERIKDGVLEIYFVEDILNTILRTFTQTELPIVLKAITIHGKKEIDLIFKGLDYHQSHQQAIKEQRKIEGYDKVKEKLEDIQERYRNLSEFFRFWQENYKPRARNKVNHIYHLIINGLMKVADEFYKERDVIIKIYPSEKDNVIGILKVSNKIVISVIAYIHQKNQEIIKESKIQEEIKGREAKEYDWQWFKQRFTLEKIKKISSSGNILARVGS